MEVAKTGPSLADLERLEGAMLDGPQEDCVTTHQFAPGVYIRTILMKAGTLIIGHEHKTEHFNIVTTGRAAVIMDGVIYHIIAPCIFKSGRGVRKVLYIKENMEWSTVHPTNETDLEKLEEALIIKSPTWLNHMALLESEKARLINETPEVNAKQ